jgi:hypothetical protein
MSTTDWMKLSVILLTMTETFWCLTSTVVGMRLLSCTVTLQYYAPCNKSMDPP